ncbi:MAG: flagellar biosynthesis protein FlhB [SAR116 cluster bacterium]|nr:flagellar biosynthesis protein FlhB [SAR116 cluster bacterium]RPH00922.1 MAG: EscU/YscU/HrcU family type III secretion system export apparatus switch protein [Candidatus Puniceispirillum sp. TMED176]
MAENKDGQEKTEEPTQKRLAKAAEDGQLLTSKEVMVFTTLAMGLLLYMGLSPFFDVALNAWGRLFIIDSVENLDTLGLAKIRTGFGLIILATLIFGTPLMIITIITQAAVGGLNFSNKAYSFKPNKIDPIAGLKRIFSVKGLVELAKAVLKVVLLFSVGALIIYTQLADIMQLSTSSLGQGLSRVSEAFPLLIGALLIVLLIIAVIDYAWQRHTFKQQMKMTLKEVKDEAKQVNGSPEVKQKIRRLQMEKSQEYARQRDALDNVADATTVITNPTHFAVALKYTAGQAGAPEVLAMGRGSLAQQIIERANAAHVTTLRIPMLARALYYTSEIGGEIAEGLYNAVAVVLAYVFRVDKGETLDMPELTLPPELRFDENGNLETGEG